MADVKVHIEGEIVKKCEFCGHTGPHIRGFFFHDDEQEFRRGTACRACNRFAPTHEKVLAN